MEQYKNIEQNRKTIIINNFLGGIAWGLGVTIGASILLGILGFIASKINLIPIIGYFVLEIINFISKNNPNLVIK